MADESMEPAGLSDRKKLILKAIVDAHIADGEPVGSKYLMESKQIPCSSATIRNEMAELEALGYLEQPHTSAGRVPSERGYRFYVDSLVEHYAMTAREIYQINEVLKSKMAELDQILLTASKVASNLTNYTAFAIKPKAASVTIRRFDVVYMDENTFVLVMVASNGQVKTKTMRPEIGRPLYQGVTDLLAAACNEHLHGLTAEDINVPVIVRMEETMGEYAPLVGIIVKAVYQTMRELDEGELKVSGIGRLLEYPEFNDPDRLQQMLGAIEKKEDILNMVDTSDHEDNGISVVIGSESEVKVMDHSALVYKPIVKEGKTLGAIGVLGPSRMDYAKVLATLEGLSGSIESLLNDSPKQLMDGHPADGPGNGDGENRNGT